jgi:PAS domain-containing protein
MRHKRILVVVRLVFFLMIASMALPGFLKGSLSPVLPVILLAYLVTNAAMLWEKGLSFFSQRIQAFLLLFDIFVLVVSLATLQHNHVELFLAMFLVVLLASAGQRLAVSVGGFVAVAAIYTYFALHFPGEEGEQVAMLTVGLPVLLVVSIYVGYVSEAVARERRQRLDMEDRLHKELRGMNRLQSLAAGLHLEHDPSRLHEAVAGTARELLGAPFAAILGVPKGEARMRASVTPGFPAALAAAWCAAPPDSSPVGRALQKGAVLRITHADETPALAEWMRAAAEQGVEEILLAPYVDRIGGDQGCLVVAWKSPHEHLLVEEEVLQVLVQHVALCIENASLYRLLTQTRDIWQAAFQSVPTPVVIVDGNSRIVQANPAFVALGGFDFANLVGSSFSDVLEGASFADGRPLGRDPLDSAPAGPLKLSIPRLSGEFDVTKGPYLGETSTGGGTVWVFRRLSPAPG